MITLAEISLTCPICDKEFTSTSVRDRYGKTSKRTDFQEYVAGNTVLPYAVHQCPRCGYAALPDEFDGPADPILQLRVWNELMPRLDDSEQVGSNKYEAAAKIALWRSQESRRVGDLWLCAAWCCVDEHDIEAERYFRRLAAWAYEDALSTFDGVPRDERAVFTYLVGELWRRIGDERSAQAWLRRVPLEVTNAKEQRWVLDSAIRQAQAPHEWFA